MSSIKMNVNVFLRTLMYKEELETQQQLANFLGVTSSQISDWKRNKKVPEKYLIKYQEYFTSEYQDPGKKAGSQEISDRRSDKMYVDEYRYQYLGETDEGLEKRFDKKTGNIEVLIPEQGWVAQGSSE